MSVLLGDLSTGELREVILKRRRFSCVYSIVKMRHLHMLPMLIAVLFYGTGISFSLHVHTAHHNSACSETAVTVHHSHNHDHAHHDHAHEPSAPADDEDLPTAPVEPSSPHHHDCATCSMLGGMSFEPAIAGIATVEIGPESIIVSQLEPMWSTQQVLPFGARGPPMV